MVLWFPQQLGILLMYFNWMVTQSIASKLNLYDSDAALMGSTVKFCIFWFIFKRSFFFNLLTWGAAATETSALMHITGGWKEAGGPWSQTPAVGAGTCKLSHGDKDESNLQPSRCEETMLTARQKLHTWDQNIHKHKCIRDISVSCLY